MSAEEGGYEELAGDIVAKQRDVLGERGVEAARNVSGLSIRDGGNTVEIEGDGKAVVTDLVEEYEEMLGQSALTTLRLAAREHADALDLPEKLEL